MSNGNAMTELIGRLTGLLHLQLQSCQIPDAGLERLQDLSKLEYLISTISQELQIVVWLSFEE